MWQNIGGTVWSIIDIGHEKYSWAVAISFRVPDSTNSTGLGNRAQNVGERGNRHGKQTRKAYKNREREKFTD